MIAKSHRFGNVISAAAIVSILTLGISAITWQEIDRPPFPPKPLTPIEQVQTAFKTQQIPPCSIIEFERGRMLVFSVRKDSATLIDEWSRDTQVYFREVREDLYSGQGFGRRIGNLTRIVRPGENGNTNTHCFR